MKGYIITLFILGFIIAFVLSIRQCTTESKKQEKPVPTPPKNNELLLEDMCVDTECIAYRKFNVGNIIIM
jgi:hypothetical protein